MITSEIKHCLFGSLLSLSLGNPAPIECSDSIVILQKGSNEIIAENVILVRSKAFDSG